MIERPSGRLLLHSIVISVPPRAAAVPVPVRTAPALRLRCGDQQRTSDL